MVKDVTWKHVAIILAFFGVIAVLAITKNETGTFVLVGMGILGGLGLVAVQAAGAKEQTTAVKEQTNGNHGRMLDILEAQGKLLAQMQPPVPSPPDDSYHGDDFGRLTEKDS